MKTTIWYRVTDHCERSRYQATIGGSYDLQDKFDARMAAQECALNYHSAHDGWESGWPLTFSLYETEDGPELARFSVERETVPQFWASAVAKDSTE